MGEIIPEKIMIESIRVLDANIVGDGESIDENQPTAFATSFSTSTGFNLEERKCALTLNIELSGLNEKEQPVPTSGSFKILFIFFIENLNDFIIYPEDKKDEYRVERALGSTLMSIAYSTCRGIVLTRTSGTIIEGAILPVIDPSLLLDAQEQVLEENSQPSNKKTAKKKVK